MSTWPLRNACAFGGVVLVAHQLHALGPFLGELGVVRRAAHGADRLAVEVGQALDVDRLGRGDHGAQHGIAQRKVDHLGAVGGVGQARDHEIGLAGLQRGNARGAGGRHVLELQAPVLGEHLGGVDVETCRLHLGVGHPVGRHAEIDGDPDLARLLDIVEGVRIGDMARAHQGRDGEGRHHNSLHLFLRLLFLNSSGPHPCRRAWRPGGGIPPPSKTGHRGRPRSGPWRARGRRSARRCTSR